jgi:pimeloyl-ACP methyl ester carboxylesterase
MELKTYKSQRPAQERLLLIMLPGVGIQAGDFAAKGFVKPVLDDPDPIDVIAAGPALDLYLDGTIAEAIQRVIIGPAKMDAHTRIWMLGLSLGGMGALLHARHFAQEVEGIILLAPFLGTPGIVAQIGAAGGFASWNPEPVPQSDYERQSLAWLKSHLEGGRRQPALYLGYGRTDRFVESHVMLADLLPPERVVVTDGQHDWDTWGRLWGKLLELRPFAQNGVRGTAGKCVGL